MVEEEDQIDFAQKTSNVACLWDAEMCLKVLETGIYLKVLETSLYLKCCVTESSHDLPIVNSSK
jgi:hypothetical protein